jgi:hypothetical protein
MYFFLCFSFFVSWSQAHDFLWLESLTSNFPVTPTDLYILQACSLTNIDNTDLLTSLNPIFSHEGVHNEHIIERTVVSSFLYNDIVGLLSIPPGTDLYYLEHRHQLPYFNKIIVPLLKHLKSYPLDSFGHYWAANLYLKLGNKEQFLSHVLQFILIMDDIMKDKCNRNSFGDHNEVNNELCNLGTMIKDHVITRTRIFYDNNKIRKFKVYYIIHHIYQFILMIMKFRQVMRKNRMLTMKYYGTLIRRLNLILIGLMFMYQ